MLILTNRLRVWRRRTHRTSNSDSAESERASLVIATPEHNTHIWRNPEQPERLEPTRIEARADRRRCADRLDDRRRAFRDGAGGRDRILADDARQTSHSGAACARPRRVSRGQDCDRVKRAQASSPQAKSLSGVHGRVIISVFCWIPDRASRIGNDIARSPRRGDALDFGAAAAQLLLQPLEAAIEMIDAVDRRLAARGERGNDKRD